MGTILKVFIELVTIFLLLLMLCLVTLSCPTLRDPVDCSLPGSSVHGIPQARILQWIAMCSSRVSSQPRYQTQGSPTAGRFFTIWATREAHEYYRGIPILSPGDLSNTGIQLRSTSWATREAQISLSGKCKELYYWTILLDIDYLNLKWNHYNKKN